MTSARASDVEAIVDLFAEGGCVLPPGAPVSTGTEALLAAYEPFRSAIGMECQYQFDEILVDGDWASARTHSTGTVLNRATGEQTPGGVA